MVIDVQHLATQTAGDDALQQELLALFAGQMHDLARDLDRGVAMDLDGLGLVLHRSRGAALAIGAFALAEDVARVETKLADEAAVASVASELGGLRDRVIEAAENATSLIAARPHGGLAKAGESG